LLLLEHPPVYTLGRNAQQGDIRLDEAALRRRGIEVHATDRGGQVTYHGPGQLVGYPILDLRPDRQDVRRYVRDLEEVLVRTLGDFGVTAEGRASPFVGVWAGQRKVASIGVHLSRWLTTHGFALNVSTDLSSFGGIVPCGLPGVEMASISSLAGGSPELADVARVCAGHFSQVFQRRLVLARPDASPTASGRRA
jgi:lipoyl(octanoyl) transferase